MDFIAFI